MSTIGANAADSRQEPEGVIRPDAEGNATLQDSSTHQTSGTGAGGAAGLSASAANDPDVPASAKDASIYGTIPGEGVGFKEQVQGHAKYFAGKLTGNDKEVQQGAARVRGVEEPQQ
ncbi:hypothetical protein CBOM_01150 [Ceraceosorus bombacis]|uniref:Uncharacterized protein n=1 Tax=Ceraceosorus bombacis TaxID=401625 RepID=A0A0P1BCY6_9BASI|nr:hypothetical protein CBOM_01150 [Ceraceosorus bombacis]